ncbi:MAG: aminotransferase class V-fold PLP-dependent enzyme [Hyphomicrobiales bacterium]|nr:aminotransferase class V-fold PLP-dependent enzyme [Hyphomicrobiales bacterium]MCP5000511.1 aminotransferase class V-fold PLP-dependent enzyme [Hyphomicrobiales bacterium]
MVLFPKDDFIGLDDKVHLASGGQPPLLKAHRQAFEAFAHDKSIGMEGYERHCDVGNDVKVMLSHKTNLPADAFALLGNASEGIARVVSSFDWQSGDNAVTSALDYASGKFSFIKLRQGGVDVRLVQPDGMFIDTDALIAACDQKTRLVYISQVNAHTGQKIDLVPLSRALRDRGIALLVDASHALGVVPLDGRLCDFMVCSSYKFLLASHMGILAWNRTSWPEFEPMQVGWNSAAQGSQPDTYVLQSDGRRAEIGNSNHLSVYILHASLKYLAKVSGEELENHVAGLSKTLYSGFQALDLDILTPASPDCRGPNISFHHPDPRAFVDQAARNNFLLWGEAGRVRASMHGFVSEADVRRFLDCLATA